MWRLGNADIIGDAGYKQGEESFVTEPQRSRPPRPRATPLTPAVPVFITIIITIITGINFLLGSAVPTETPCGRWGLLRCAPERRLPQSFESLLKKNSVEICQFWACPEGIGDLSIDIYKVQNWGDALAQIYLPSSTVS